MLVWATVAFLSGFGVTDGAVGCERTRDVLRSGVEIWGPGGNRGWFVGRGDNDCQRRPVKDKDLVWIEI